MTPAPDAARIDALDALRGAALLGILVLNVPGYAWPGAYPFVGPGVPGAGAVDAVAWIVGFVLFDGKMRGLFGLLFGASMALMLDRAAGRGTDGVARQRRRLGWLALFGAMHFLLLWFGDILFSYALAGLFLLLVRDWPPGRLMLLAAALLVVGILVNAATYGGLHAIEAAARAPGADAAAVKAWADQRAILGLDARWEAEVAAARGGWGDAIAARAGDWIVLAFGPVVALYDSVPMMLAGMAAVRGGWLADGAGRRLRLAARLLLPAGLAAHGLMAVVLTRSGFVPSLMAEAQMVWAGVPRAVLTLGYGAAGLLLFRRFADHPLTARLRAAGRMALTNYLGMSLVMAPLFTAGAAPLFAAVPPAGLWLAILGGWALMLGGSAWWLARHPQGPMEALWRRLAGGA